VGLGKWAAPFPVVLQGSCFILPTMTGHTQRWEQLREPPPRTGGGPPVLAVRVKNNVPIAGSNPVVPGHRVVGMQAIDRVKRQSARSCAARIREIVTAAILEALPYPVHVRHGMKHDAITAAKPRGGI